MTVLPLLEGLHLLDWRDITIVLKLTLTGLTVLSITAILVNEVVRFRNRIPKLPGPRGYPLLGSLPSLKNTATSEEYRLWANKYGPVFQVQLGNETAVVVNSAAAARALFITQREATNGRPISYVLHKQVQQGGPVTSIGTSPWDESCKRRRKVAATALNKAQVESYYPILNLEARAFIRDILAGCGNGDASLDILGIAHRFSMNMSLTLAYGTRVEDVRDLHKDNLVSEILYVEDEIKKFRNPFGNYLNYIPLLRPINTVAGWLGSGKKAHMADIGRRRYGYHAVLQEKLKKDIALGIDRPCIQGNVLKDPESKGLTEGELLSISMSMMAGTDTTKRSLVWAMLLLSHRPDIQEKAYQAIKEADSSLLQSPNVAHSKVEYIEALAKEVLRYFTVLRLALPKATHGYVEWQGAVIPPKTLLFLNCWACARDPAVFADPEVFAPERWMDGEMTANKHQFAFGMGGRMCVASHVASKGVYTVLFQLISHFRLLPTKETEDPIVADPVRGLTDRENPQASPAATRVRFIPRNSSATKWVLSAQD